MAKKITYSLEVELTEAQAQALCCSIPGNKPDSWKLSGVALAALLDLSEGGMIMRAQATRRVLELIPRYEDEQDLVAAVEKGVGQDQGRMVGKWYVDPTFEEPIRAVARSRAETVDQVITDLMNWQVAQGTLYDLPPETKVMFFSKEDWMTVSEVVGTDFPSGSEIAGFLESQATAPVSQ